MKKKPKPQSTISTINHLQVKHEEYEKNNVKKKMKYSNTFYTH